MSADVLPLSRAAHLRYVSYTEKIPTKTQTNPQAPSESQISSGFNGELEFTISEIASAQGFGSRQNCVFRGRI